MKTVLVIGMVVVNIALFFYSIGSIALFRRRKASAFVIWSLSIGLLFDAFATACMISGSSQGGITLHGMIGYSALVAMAADVSSLLRLKKQCGWEAELPRRIFVYSIVAYVWWVAAYITGAIIVALR